MKNHHHSTGTGIFVALPLTNNTRHSQNQAKGKKVTGDQSRHVHQFPHFISPLLLFSQRYLNSHAKYACPPGTVLPTCHCAVVPQQPRVSLPVTFLHWSTLVPRSETRLQSTGNTMVRAITSLPHFDQHVKYPNHSCRPVMHGSIMLRENQVVCDCDLATAIVIQKTSEAHCQWSIAFVEQGNPYTWYHNPSTRPL